MSHYPVMSYTTPGRSETDGYGSIFYNSIAEVFVHKIYPREKVISREPRGCHRSGTENCYFRKNLNCGQCFNDKQNIFCVLQIRDRLSLNQIRNNLVRSLGLPLQHPKISQDFDGFSIFLKKKTETSFRSIFCY